MADSLSKEMRLMAKLTGPTYGILAARQAALNQWMCMSSFATEPVACYRELRQQSKGVLTKGMVEMPEIKLSFMEKDAMAEVASIACGNASATLSNLIGGRSINFTNPIADVPPLKDIPKLAGGPKKLVVGTYLPIRGDVSGNMAVIFPRESAFLLIDLSENKKLGTTQAIDEKGQKLINEAGLAVISAYLSALDTLFKFKTSHGAPKFISTFGESITDFISLELEEAERIFLNSFKISFSIGPEIKGEIMFLFALAPVDSLLRAIRSKLETPKGE